MHQPGWTAATTSPRNAAASPLLASAAAGDREVQDPMLGKRSLKTKALGHSSPVGWKGVGAKGPGRKLQQGCGAGGSPEHILRGGSALLCCCQGDGKQRVGDVSVYIRIVD